MWIKNQIKQSNKINEKIQYTKVTKKQKYTKQKTIK